MPYTGKTSSKALYIDKTSEKANDKTINRYKKYKDKKHYTDKKYLVNKRVLMARLKSLTASKVRMFAGRALNRTGPATENDLSPRFLVFGGTARVRLDADRSDLDGT